MQTFWGQGFYKFVTVVSNIYRNICQMAGIQKYLFKWMYMYELVHGSLNLEAYIFLGNPSEEVLDSLPWCFSSPLLT